MSKKCTAVVARSTFRSHNVQNTLHVQDHFVGSCDVEKLHAGVARSTFRSQKCKKTISKKTDRFGPLLEIADVVSRGKRQGIVHLVKSWAKREGFVAFPKTDGRRGTFEEDLAKMHFRVAGASTRDMFIRDVRRSGHWIPETGCILEHQISQVCWRWFGVTGASTSYDLASLFRGRRSSFRQMVEKSQKRIGTRAVSSALNFPFLKEVSQNCFIFWCCQLRKLRNSRRIVLFLMLSSSKIEEVSQNCLFFDVVKFKNWGSLAELLHFQACRTDRQTNRQAGRQADR